MRKDIASKLRERGINIVDVDNTHLLNASREYSAFECPCEIRAGRYDVEKIGAFTYLGGGSSTVIRHVARIGRYCSIASNIVAGQVEHPTNNYLTTSPIFHMNLENMWPRLAKFYKHNADVSSRARIKFASEIDERYGKIKIGHDVWIGEGVFIKRGVSIGHGAIVAARSVVVKDVPPYAIVGGAPARVIRYRFDEKLRSALIETRWWAYEISVLNGADMSAPQAALEVIRSNIDSGAKIYAPAQAIVRGQSEYYLGMPDIEGITDGRDLPVVVHIGGRALTLNFNDRHERAYYYGENGGRQTLDAFVAGKCIRAGDVVLDAGAHIGYTALLYLKHGAKRVFACEPEKENLARLRRVATENLVVKGVALSDEVGTVELILSTAHSQGHTLVRKIPELFPSTFGRPLRTIDVESTTVDSMFSDVAFDFVKLDVEGAEAKVLRGAQGNFAKYKPRCIQVEVYEPFREEVFGQLMPIYEYVYRVVVAEDGRINFARVNKGGDLSWEGGAPPVYVFCGVELE